MILDGERSGKLTRGKTLIDSTSGNTGIAYAMIGAKRGYKVKLCLPANASLERKRILKAYGAELVFSDPPTKAPTAPSAGAARFTTPIRTAISIPISTTTRQLEGALRDTGPEIIEQTDGRITHFVALLGHQRHVHRAMRGGFRRDLPDVKCISAQPSSGFHGLEGTKHMPTAIVPRHLRRDAGRRQHWIETEDAIPDGAAPGARGRPAGGNLRRRQRAAPPLQIAQELREQGRKGVIVTVLCDSADKYLSEHFWDEE